MLIFPAASHGLLYANHKLHQDTHLSDANISQLQAIRCHHENMPI